MIGLDRLKKVLPNIFRAFPAVSPNDVLLECGLHPIASGGEFPTFFFNPLAGCPLSPAKKRKRPPSDEVVEPEIFRSQELFEAYEAARSEWSA